jgi:peptidoglycan/xylan/chitin deacetylase (PgdA/CDA1 family)
MEAPGIGGGMTDRDLIGYGGRPPHPEWPGGAKLALSLVVNYEEGAELGFEQGDPVNEKNGEVSSPVPDGLRDRGIEQMFNYGLRAGLWRVLDVLARHGRQATFFMCARAVERTPHLAAAVVAAGHEPACHGWRWTNHVGLADRAAERALLDRCVAVIRDATGERPRGFYCRWAQGPHTRALLREEEGFLYDSNAYDDDLPYWDRTLPGGPMLVLPYALDANDMKFFHPNGWATPQAFLDYLRCAVDQLVHEGTGGIPKMLSVGLHLRIIGRPARLWALDRFLEHVAGYADAIWVARRLDIARHWIGRFPP